MTRELASKYHARLKAYHTALASRSEVQMLPLVAWSSGREGIAPEVVCAAESNVLNNITRCLPLPVQSCWRVQERVPARLISHHLTRQVRWCTDSASAPVRFEALNFSRYSFK